MRCEQASEMMSLRLDHYLDDAADVDQHLATCVACSGEWAALQAVTRLFENPPMAQPPPDFARRVMARVADRPTPQVNPWRNLGGWLVLIIGTLALGLVALSPTALDVWRSWQPLLAAGGAAAVVGAATGVRDGLLAWPMTALGVLRLVPPPLLVGYMLSTLLLATVWVVLVGHLNLQRRITTA
ncbi:MAG: zf-HC2 domain-containing protein [Anaerolineae bacterium]|mgnify:CR=1 FL=1|nr:zf-HC2 domain-containing protein [Anaerolineae bacterium]